MKTLTSTAAALLLATLTPTLFAEEPAGAKCGMCEMMKAKALAETQQQKIQAQSAELDKLVAEMNGTMGRKKLEAMAAVVARLVEQTKALSAATVAAPAPTATPKEPAAHQH